MLSARRVAAAAALLLLAAETAVAQGLSIDRVSPSASLVSNSAILVPGPVGGPPAEAIPPGALGLSGGETDEIDAITFGAAAPGLRLHFSVDRASLGLAGDVVAEAAAGQAAGDLFASDLDGTNALVVDQHVLGLVPSGPAGVAFDPPADEVDAFDFAYDGSVGLIVYALEPGHPLAGSGVGCGGDLFFSGSLFLGFASLGLGSCLDDVDAVEFDSSSNTFYYSLAPGSPALQAGSPIAGCSGGCSAADVFAIQAGAPAASVFATAASLGLRDTDDVDALSFAQPAVPLPALGSWGAAVAAALLAVAGARTRRATDCGPSSRRATVGAEVVPMRLVLCLVLTLALGTLVGCSSFKSSSSPSRWSGQSSKASSSPSRWSSGSSGGGEAQESDEQSYERDVRETAATVVQGGGGGYELMRRLGPVAAEHGISDWEGDPITYRAIGAGLAQGGLSVNAFEQVSRDIAAGSQVRGQLLLEGYSSTP